MSNKKHSATLRAIRQRPTPTNIKWSDMEKLALALGARVQEGSGSRVKLILNGEPGDFHRPHPGKECKQYMVRDFADWLDRAGVTKETES